MTWHWYRFPIPWYLGHDSIYMTSHQCRNSHCGSGNSYSDKTELWYRIRWNNKHQWEWIGSSHYGDVIIVAITSQITSLTIVYSTVYSDTDQRKHQSSASLAFVRGIHRGPVNSPHKWPVTLKCFHLMTSSCTISTRAIPIRTIPTRTISTRTINTCNITHPDITHTVNTTKIRRIRFRFTCPFTVDIVACVYV